MNQTSVLHYRLRFKKNYMTVLLPILSQAKSWRPGRAPVSHLRELGSNLHYSMHLFFLEITIRDTCINRVIPVNVTT